MSHDNVQCTCVLTTIDDLTRFAVLGPLQNKERETVARALVDWVISIFGPPETLHSNQGREFENKMIYWRQQVLWYFAKMDESLLGKLIPLPALHSDADSIPRSDLYIFDKIARHQLAPGRSKPYNYFYRSVTKVWAVAGLDPTGTRDPSVWRNDLGIKSGVRTQRHAPEHAAETNTQRASTSSSASQGSGTTATSRDTDTVQASFPRRNIITGDDREP